MSMNINRTYFVQEESGLNVTNYKINSYTDDQLKMSSNFVSYGTKTSMAIENGGEITIDIYVLMVEASPEPTIKLRLHTDPTSFQI